MFKAGSGEAKEYAHDAWTHTTASLGGTAA